MRKYLILVATGMALAACGSSKPAPRQTATYVTPTPSATGPLASACLASDRSARSRALCGCIQAVANGSLTLNEQRRAVAFYTDPHLAQTIRQSDKPSDEKFWQAYSGYAERAERVCR